MRRFLVKAALTGTKLTSFRYRPFPGEVLMVRQEGELAKALDLLQYIR